MDETMATGTLVSSSAPPLRTQASVRTANVAVRLIWWSLGVWFLTRTLDVIVTIANTKGDLVSHWYFWDAGFYKVIEAYGYVPSDPRLAAYFPLYPLLAHMLTLTHLPAAVAMLLITNVATLAAFILCAFLVWRETRCEYAAVWAILLLGASPLGVFLAAMYGDSLFLALAAGAWLTARSYHWRWTALLLALAMITRPFGVALALGLALELARQRGWSLRFLALNWREVALLLALPSASLVAFLALLWRVYGSPLAMLVAEKTRFGHALWWPWQTIALAIQQLAVTPLWSYARLHMLLDVVPVLLCLAVALIMAQRWPLSFSAYLLFVVTLCLISPVISAAGQYALVSDGRYCYAAMPLLAIPLSRLGARWPLPTGALLLMSLILQLTLTVYLLHGGWLV